MAAHSWRSTDSNLSPSCLVLAPHLQLSPLHSIPGSGAASSSFAGRLQVFEPRTGPDRQAAKGVLRQPSLVWGHSLASSCSHLRLPSRTEHSMRLVPLLPGDRLENLLSGTNCLLCSSHRVLPPAQAGFPNTASTGNKPGAAFANITRSGAADISETGNRPQLLKKYPCLHIQCFLRLSSSSKCFSTVWEVAAREITRFGAASICLLTWVIQMTRGPSQRGGHSPTWR